MKYCITCGKQIDDDATFCPFCGANQNSQYNSINNDNTNYNQTTQYNIVGQDNVNKKDSTLKLVAFILALLTTIGCGFFLIPLIWQIPMTVSIYKAYKGEKKLSVGFNVCTLLFLNTISGILLLIDNE